MTDFESPIGRRLLKAVNWLFDMEWQPMRSAPHDGRVVVVFHSPNEGRKDEAYFQHSRKFLTVPRDTCLACFDSDDPDGPGFWKLHHMGATTVLYPIAWSPLTDSWVDLN